MRIKKILVPTDFSEAAHNALRYAADLAEKFGADVDIMHAYTIPVLTARGRPVLTDPGVAQENLQVADAKLEETKEMISANRNVTVNIISAPIYWKMELPGIIHDQHTDLIVMGTTGASGLKKIFMGSNAASVIQNVPVPMLIVPENASLSRLNKIGFAFDGSPLKHIENLAVVNAFGHVLDARIHVFQMLNSRQEPSPHLAQLMDYLAGAEYDDVDENDVESRILKCIELYELGMLVMIPRRRGFFHKLISGSMTERVAYEIDIPLLAVPG